MQKIERRNNKAIEIYLKLKKLFSALVNYGVSNEKDESKQKYIVMMNLISLVSFSGLFSTGFILVFLNEYFQAFLHFIGGFVWLLPIYINRNGLKLASRLIVIFYSGIVLLLCSCWFTHYSTLDNYFLIVAITCLFLFSPQEKNWLMVCISFCLILFVIESTPLQEYLPAYNTLTGQRLAITNIVLLIGQIILILLDVVSFVYLNTIRENSLIQKQKALEDAQHKVQVQNDDLQTFSIAASHSMQTPIQVCTFFLEKVISNPIVYQNYELKENVEITQNGLRQIDQLVSGLFSYNHIINIENEMERFNVQAELYNIRDTILPNYPGCIISIDGGNFIIKANLMLFSIILHNLITNGLKYNTSDLPTVKVLVSKNLSKCSFLIKDNGMGIDPEYLPTIFEAFKKIPKFNGINSGNGLGLACSKRAAERMNGTLKCISSNKQGSDFLLEIKFQHNVLNDI